MGAVTGKLAGGFVPAAELSRAFYDEVVRPPLGERPHAAALLGWGSDVLGYDTERSTDRGWGPRLLVFLDEAAVETVQRSVSARASRRVPRLAGAVRLG